MRDIAFKTTERLRLMHWATWWSDDTNESIMRDDVRRLLFTNHEKFMPKIIRNLRKGKARQPRSVRAALYSIAQTQITFSLSIQVTLHLPLPPSQRICPLIPRLLPPNLLQHLLPPPLNNPRILNTPHLPNSFLNPLPLPNLPHKTSIKHHLRQPHNQRPKHTRQHPYPITPRRIPQQQEKSPPRTPQSTRRH